MNKEIKKYIDNLNNEQLIEILNTSKDIDKYIDENYTGIDPIKKNYKINDYIKSKLIKSSIIGFIIGDAFGVPYEFLQRNCVNNKNMKGYGTHNQPVGTWSDDSSMMLATLDSLNAFGKVNIDDIMDNFISWYHNNAFTPHGKVFDIGGRTACAISYYHLHDDILPDKTQTALGNGSLMRILPLAFYDVSDEDIEKVNDLTHPNDICRKACKIYIKLIRQLINGENIINALYDLNDEFTSPFDRLSHINDIPRESIASTGYVVDTLEAAVWSVLNSNNYKEAIITATDLGGDTDTIAAITGGIAGIIWGVPDDWENKIVKLDGIKNMIENYNFQRF